MKNEEKGDGKPKFSRPFSEVFLSTLGVQNHGKMSKNLPKMRSENDNGDFSKIVLSCTREHDF